MNSSSESTSPFAKRYTDAFKQEALALIAAGRSMSQLSRELGVSVWTLGEWKKQASRQDTPDNACPSKADPTTAALAAEVVLLRKQLAKSEQRADILKKALAILGQDPTDASK